jgi:hypothetical protein
VRHGPSRHGRRPNSTLRLTGDKLHVPTNGPNFNVECLDIDTCFDAFEPEDDTFVKIN